MKKINKKKLAMFVLPILAIALVSAITYYAVFSVTLNVNQPIQLTGDLQQSLGCVAGETCFGEGIGITNEGEFERNVLVTIDSHEEIQTKFVRNILLTKKTVDFTKDVWEVPVGADQVTMTYTVIGDEFEAEADFVSGYTLIYYKDNSDRFVNPAEAILIEDVLGNLPYETDGNIDEYDYCLTEEYDTCHGAKIWYVPSNALIGGVIDWSRASEFYFETELIQFNSEGSLTMYPTQTITLYPEYTVGSYLPTGDYVVDITIA